MAALFADDARLTIDEDSANGRKAIAAFLTTRFGGGRQGLVPGAINTQLIDEPVVNLSVDGRMAEGRWVTLAEMKRLLARMDERDQEHLKNARK